MRSDGHQAAWEKRNREARVRTDGKVDYARYPFCKSQFTPAEQAALDRDWQPYLDEKTSFESALHDLVRDAR
jgi:hypothetical protein